MSKPQAIRCESRPGGKEARLRPFARSGHSLVELVVALSLLGVCFAVGGVALGRGLSSVEARGAAQGWQAAATWGQTGALWQGVARDVRFTADRMAVEAESPLAASASGIPGTQSGDLGNAAPSVPVSANITRWRADQGVIVRFGEGTAYPNSAGSLFFHALGSDYRVTVRLESGLTTRTRVESAP